MTATPPPPITPPTDSSADPAPSRVLPELDLRQVQQMTDDTGMFQHALYATPDPRHGYCIDDNARALIAALLHARLRGYDEAVLPLRRYLMFLAFAFNEDAGVFRNFMGYDRNWLEDVGSNDSQGRTIWALGLTVRIGPDENIRDLARDLLERALPGLKRIDSMRAWAFTVLGLTHFLEAHPDAEAAREIRDDFAARLLAMLDEHASDDWPWWEDLVTYDNAKLCQALITYGHAAGKPEFVERGLRSLRWLLDVQTERDDDGRPYLSIIGNDGWLPRGGKRATFDQQPLEGYAMVDALLEAARVTGEGEWRDDAWMCFEWFTGRNVLGQSMVNAETGGCQDGLQPGRVNRNQGAESVLAYLISALELHLAPGWDDPKHEKLDEKESDVTTGPSVNVVSEVGLAVVGASGFARFCLEHYRGVQGLRPRGVWSRTGKAAEDFATATGVVAFDELEALLADPGVQLVHVAGTPDTHATQALAALKAGKDVILEKPIALSSVDGQRLRQEAASRDRVLAINHMMPHGPLIDPIRSIIQQGVLGVPLRGVVTNRAGDAGLPASHWFWDPAKSGGIFIEHGVHFFDLVGRLLGPGRVLHAYRLPRPGAELVDQVGCDIQHGPQCVVSHYHGFTQAPHTDRQQVTLVFERGQLTLTGWIQYLLELELAVDDTQLEAVMKALPAAEIVTERKVSDTVRRRGRDESITRVTTLRLAACEDDGDARQELYGQALASLLRDTLASMQNRRRALKVTADEAIAALVLAEDATRLSRSGVG